MSLLSPKAHLPAVRQFIMLMTQHRRLTWAMARREITDRYTGQLLGTLWAVGHPLLLMALYVFVFGYIFTARINISDAMPGSFVLFLLAGLIPWMTFGEVLTRGPTVIIAHGSLVKQVVFPIETLPVKTVLAACVTQLIATALLLGYMTVTRQPFAWTLVLLPVLFAWQMMAMVGAAYLLSSVGAYIRDLKEVMQVCVTAGLYLSPILFLPELIQAVWPPLEYILWVNPFSHMVWCYQDAVYFGRFDHPVSWALMLLGSPLILYVGYRVFVKLKISFGDVL